MNIFTSLFGNTPNPNSTSRDCGVEFLTTQGISYHLEQMIKMAKQQILIVSPYIKLHPRIIELLHERKMHGVRITFVYRENFNDSGLATDSFQRTTLHSKCYLTEQAALLGSMNLYDYSQINNDEMGIYIPKESSESLYWAVMDEARRLCKPFPAPKPTSTPVISTQPNSIALEKGRKYLYDELEEIFAFVDSYRKGIRDTINGNVVLFCSSGSHYQNEERNGILYFQGQNTGTEEQQLLFGNKVLYDCRQNRTARIFLFKDLVYHGEQILCEEPFKKNGVWFFPLRNK